MNPVEPDSSGIPSTTCVDDVSSKYTASYLESFLPVFSVMNQSAISTLADRYKAIKFAADASLAITASGASWSDALSKQLVEDRGSGATGDLERDDRLANCFQIGATSMASAPSGDRTSELGSANYVCETSGLSENDSWTMKVDGNSLDHRKGLGERRKISFRLTGREGRKYCSRKQRFSRDASRLAILRTLSLRIKSKNRLISSRRPRATRRKAKCLAKVRRRSSWCPQNVECSEPDRRFENSIVALQRLVPGGTNMDATVLLDEAADFVMFLKLQVQALQSVANAVDEQFVGIAPTA